MKKDEIEPKSDQFPVPLEKLLGPSSPKLVYL